MTRDFKTWIRAGWLTDPLLDDRDVILFPEKVNGKFVMMHRPLEWVGPGLRHRPRLRLDRVQPTTCWASRLRQSRLLIKNKYPWEAFKLGINTPPIKTPHGWFTLYHAVGPDKFYRLGALLLDLNDPSRVLHRTPDWLMQPETDYEIEGFYRGVCFPCGTVVIDGTLFVYYGGGDKYCAVATCDFGELIEHLRGVSGVTPWLVAWSEAWSGHEAGRTVELVAAPGSDRDPPRPVRPRSPDRGANGRVDREVAGQVQFLDEFDDVRLVLVARSGLFRPAIQLQRDQLLQRDEPGLIPHLDRVGWEGPGTPADHLASRQ